MPIKEADFTRDDVVSWHSIEQAARREGVERIALTPAQVQMLTNDLHACLAGRKRAEESAFRVPPPAQWHGLTCVACYGPACMSTASGRAYCFEHSLGRAEHAQVADYKRGAETWMARCIKAEEERDAMALALARKEIAK